MTKRTAVRPVWRRAASAPGARPRGSPGEEGRQCRQWRAPTGIAAVSAVATARISSSPAGIRVTTPACASPGAEGARPRDLYGDETFCAR